MPAAVCLIITASLNGALGILGVIGGLAQIKNLSNRPSFGNDAERFGYVAGQFGGLLVFVLNLVVAPMIIYGAIKMLGGTNFGWAKAAAILAMIPLTSCCFLVGAPIGIWSLIVLSKPEARMFFERGADNYQPPPPPPPQYYSPN